MSFRAEQEAAQAADPPRWTLPAVEVTDSITGSHQLHRFVGRWAGTPGEWVVLTDKASGAAVLEMARVRTASVSWRPDGALMIRLGGAGNARLFLIAPDMGSYRDVGIDSVAQPLTALQEAVTAAARELGADGGHRQPADLYLDRDFSPDGDLIVEYEIHPQRMSHETRVPRLILAATGETVLTMPSSQYDGTLTWRDGAKLDLFIRHYDRGGQGVSAEVDWARRTIMIDTRSYPLSHGTREIERAFRQPSRPAAAAAAAFAASEPGRFKNAFAVIALTILLMGGIALASWWFTEPARQEITPMKPIPKPTPPGR